MAFALLSIISTSVHAGCGFIAEVTNDKYQIDISDRGCGPYVMITVAKVVRVHGEIVVKSDSELSYKFDDECKLEGNILKCRAGGILHWQGRRTRR